MHRGLVGEVFVANSRQAPTRFPNTNTNTNTNTSLMQSAILRTYINNRGDYTERLVQISADHDWSGGPHQDTVPFSVGSNQYLYPAEDANPETLSALRDDQHQS